MNDNRKRAIETAFTDAELQSNRPDAQRQNLMSFLPDLNISFNIEKEQLKQH